MTKSSTNPRTRWRFEPFELDPWAGRLSHEGRAVTIQAQPLKLLTLLVSRHGSLVTREEIRDFLWGETHVDYEQGIHYAIRQVRQALGDSVAEPQFVETVPGEGYRWIAPVLEAPAETEKPKNPARWVQWLRPRFALRLMQWGLPALLAFAVLMVLLQVEGRGVLPGDFGFESPTPRILVVPFSHNPPLPEEPWLGEMLAEEVVSALGQRLQGRLDPLAIETTRRWVESDQEHSDLDIEYRVGGSIRRVGSELRIHVWLTGGTNQVNRWSGSYRRADSNQLPELGRDLAEAIALELVGRDGRRPLREPQICDAEAYDKYAEARDLLDRNLALYNPDGEKAIARAHRLLESALEKDPTYAAVHAEMARLHIWRKDWRTFAPPNGSSRNPRIPDEGKAREHVRLALLLDEELEQAHVLQAALSLFWDLDLEGAERSLDRALELNPSLAAAHHLRGTVLMVSGREDAAVAALLRALTLSPLDEILHLTVGRHLFALRRNEEARWVFARSQELLRPPIECISCLRLEMHMEIERGDRAAAVRLAEQELRRMAAIDLEVPPLDAGTPEEDLDRYWQWRLNMQPDTESLVDRASVMVALGRHEDALGILERVPHHREDPHRVFLGVDPRFDPIREDPRFREVLTELFPEKYSPANLEETRKGAGGLQQPQREASLRNPVRPYR